MISLILAGEEFGCFDAQAKHLGLPRRREEVNSGEYSLVQNCSYILGELVDLAVEPAVEAFRSCMSRLRSVRRPQSACNTGHWTVQNDDPTVPIAPSSWTRTSRATDHFVRERRPKLLDGVRPAFAMIPLSSSCSVASSAGIEEIYATPVGRRIPAVNGGLWIDVIPRPGWYAVPGMGASRLAAGSQLGAS